jgi:tetratricopeptide (TPR) repeat protein
MRRETRSPAQDRIQMPRILAAVPPPSDAEFPQAVRKVLEKVDDPESALRAILDGTSATARVRFVALYGLLLRLRREDRYREYGALVATYEDEFGSEPYFHTFRAIVAQMKGDLSSLRSAVEYSRQAVALIPDHAAVVHQLAAFWVEYLERLDNPKAHDLDEVERQVDRAIALSRGAVAHYFETKGRALALRGEFEAARASVAHAIELEPRASRDYLRRLTQYQSTRLRIDLLEDRARWAASHDQFRAELVEFKGQQLQLLGLLAAVVAFIATASNIAGQVGGRDGIRLILVASGAMAVVFGTFSMVSNARFGRVLIAVAVGAVLIAAGLLIPQEWIG